MSDQSVIAFSNLSNVLRRVVDVISEGADMLFNAGPRMTELRRLVATSEEELSARGLTRAGEVDRILGHR